MRALAKNALCGLYRYSGAMGAQERVAAWTGRRRLAILLFHRVTDAIPPDGLTVSTRWFGGFCRLMRDRFHVVPLAELVRLSASSEAIPRRTVAITFDDCYHDNLPAARTLAEHGLPAAFFVPSRYVGTEHVFPWDAGLPRLANLSWDDVRTMAALGHEIGSHTVTHADLGAVAPDEARRELIESRHTIEERLGQPVRYLAYPFGGRGNFRPEYLELTREAGYEAVFSGHGGFLWPPARLPILPREPVPYFHSLLNLELHLAGCLDWFYDLKRRVGLLG